jgi:hypothetical protein
LECVKTDPGIVAAVCIALQGFKTVGCIIVRAGIAKQGLPTCRSIAVTAKVGGESRNTNGGVLGSGRVIKKCNGSNRRVVSGELPKKTPSGFTLAVPVLLKSANDPVAVFELPPTLLKSAATPIAVFSLATLTRSVPAPTAVLKLPSVGIISAAGEAKQS